MWVVGIVGRRNYGLSELWIVGIMSRWNYESSELWVVGIIMSRRNYESSELWVRPFEALARQLHHKTNCGFSHPSSQLFNNLTETFIININKGILLPLLQKTLFATSQNHTPHSSVQHMIMIPSVKTTKFGLRSIKFNHFKNNPLHTKSKSLSLNKFFLNCY